MTNYVFNAFSGKVVDDPDYSTRNGTQVIQYQLNEGVNQRWSFVPLANGNDLIVNSSSSKVVDKPISRPTPLRSIQYQLITAA